MERNERKIKMVEKLCDEQGIKITEWDTKSSTQIRIVIPKIESEALEALERLCSNIFMIEGNQNQKDHDTIKKALGALK